MLFEFFLNFLFETDHVTKLRLIQFKERKSSSDRIHTYIWRPNRNPHTRPCTS